MKKESAKDTRINIRINKFMLAYIKTHFANTKEYESVSDFLRKCAKEKIKKHSKGKLLLRKKK